MWKKSGEGSTRNLIELCFGYFFFYVITGISVKYFESSKPGFPAMDGMEYLVYSTIGGTLIATLVAVGCRWYHLQSLRLIEWRGHTFPSELLYIIPSGIMTAIIIPTTTLMYSFKNISVMVAMVVMRGMVIIIGRVVDAIQIRQGILQKKVYAEENIAVLFALLAAGTKFINPDLFKGKSPFSSIPFMVIFTAYILAYALRIYIMNYYKNTRPKDSAKSKVDNNKAFFALEQIVSTLVLCLVIGSMILAVTVFGVGGSRITPAVNAILHPNPRWWHWAIFSGMAYGMVAFFSVFIFMFKGRTATFANLVNRLTSLVAGTTATMLFALYLGGSLPKSVDWLMLAFLLIAVGFMTVAERKRAREVLAGK